MSSKKQQVVVEPEVQTEVQTEVETQVDIQVQTSESLINELSQMISGLKVNIRECEVALKVLKSQYKHDLKNSRKKRSKTVDRVKRGKFKKVQLSDAICAFLKVPKSSVMERGEATKRVYEYIKEKQLYREGGPRIFMEPDNKLSKLLGPLEFPMSSNKPELGSGLSIYNMQRYLQKHFTTVQDS